VADDLSDAAAKLLDLNLLQLAKDGSDLRVLVSKQSCRMFMTVEGEIKELRPSPPAVIGTEVARSARQRAGLSVTERAMPQTGSICLNALGQNVNVRVVSAPSVEGETLVFSVSR
jgi:general secretion pathway protein E